MRVFILMWIRIRINEDQRGRGMVAVKRVPCLALIECRICLRAPDPLGDAHESLAIGRTVFSRPRPLSKMEKRTAPASRCN